MASDLDRAYVINGDDLRIALGSHNWAFIPGADPRDGHLTAPAGVAHVVLEEVAMPLEEYQARQPGVYPLVPVSEPMLADALQAAGVGSPVTTAETVFARLDERWRTELAKPAKPIVLQMGDTEASAIGCIVAAFADLTVPGRRRVAAYLWHRFGGEVTP